MRTPHRWITLSTCTCYPFSCLLFVREAGPCFPLARYIKFQILRHQF
jgi:hypothetical protein